MKSGRRAKSMESEELSLALNAQREAYLMGMNTSSLHRRHMSLSSARHIRQGPHHRRGIKAVSCPQQDREMTCHCGRHDRISSRSRRLHSLQMWSEESMHTLQPANAGERCVCDWRTSKNVARCHICARRALPEWASRYRACRSERHNDRSLIMCLSQYLNFGTSTCFAQMTIW